MDEERCPDHPDAQVVEDYRAGDCICSECGLVVGDRVVDVGTEWRTFASSDKKKSGADPSRVGAAEDELLGSNELQTYIGNVGKPGQVVRMEGLLRTQAQVRSATQNKALTRAFGNIKQYTARMHLPQSTERAAMRLFKDVHETKKLKSRSNEAVSAACLYIACRQEGAARTFKEMVAVTKVPKKDMSRAYKAIAKAVDLGGLGQVSASAYMSRFCSQLGLPRKVQLVAEQVSDAASDYGVVEGRSPDSRAAAAVLMAALGCGEPITLEKIRHVCGVAESTIRTSYREMYPIKEYLFPAAFDNKLGVMNLPTYGPACSHGLEGPKRVRQRLKDGLLVDRSSWAIKAEAAVATPPAAAAAAASA